MRIKRYILFPIFIIVIFQNIYGQTTTLKDLFTSDWHKISFTIKVGSSFYLTDYKTLIIAEVTGKYNRSSNESENIYDNLSAKIQEIPGIHLLDRKKTETILKEYNFQRGGYVEEDYITRFGQFYSSGIIMTGRVIDSKYKSDLISSSATANGKRKKYRTGTQNISFSFQFIDIATSEIVYSNTLDIQKTIRTHWSYSTPPKVNQSAVYTAAIEMLSNDFKNLFVLHNKAYNVDLQKNTKFNEKLKKAAALIQVSEYEDAYVLLNEIVRDKKVLKNNKALSSAYYNLALFELYTNKHDQAKQNAKKGYLENPKNEACLKLVKILQQGNI